MMTGQMNEDALQRHVRAMATSFAKHEPRIGRLQLCGLLGKICLLTLPSTTSMHGAWLTQCTAFLTGLKAITPELRHEAAIIQVLRFVVMPEDSNTLASRTLGEPEPHHLQVETKQASVGTSHLAELLQALCSKGYLGVDALYLEAAHACHSHKNADPL